MDVANRGSSIYHETQALYVRRPDGELLAVEGRQAHKVKAAWPVIQSAKTASCRRTEEIVLPSGGKTEIFRIAPLELPDGANSLEDLIRQGPAAGAEEEIVVRLQELQRPDQDEVIGMISLVPASMEKSTKDFRCWAGLFILSETRLFSRQRHPGSDEPQAKDLARRITDLFEQHLRNVGPADEWSSGKGREYFEERVLAFTERQARVDFCLPAFPCKSSNPQKTSGVYPDKAEAIALDVLRSFVQKVGRIYEPGAKIWIISDGHVFSDCGKSCSL